MAKEIPLTRGHSTIVDDADYPYLSGMKWFSLNNSRSFCAARNQWVDGKRKTVCMHRIILNAPSNMMVDHINGDTLDNRRCNLRLVTNQQNCWNTKKHKDNKSGFKGVVHSSSSNKYWAHITVDGKQKYLGIFTEPISAALVYDTYAKLYFGEYAKTFGFG